ncbi:hypothetical protein K438DRAFT_62909 [Mycena galopus ATCC 62051]|nr:hypothetical protein K438DRAFT_62909 [Mycena galopus ATCC 62051]
MIEIWQDESHPVNPISTVFPPSPAQEAAAKSNIAHFHPHFCPAATIPVDSGGKIGIIKLLYPTLVVSSSAAVYVWNVQTGKLICTLDMHDDENEMFETTGVAVSQELILAFNRHQIRFFSRHDGLAISYISRANSVSDLAISRGAQLLPPDLEGAMAFAEAVLQPQRLFHKRRGWSCSRGYFTLFGISTCGMTLVILSSKRRMLIVNDVEREVMQDLTTAISSAADVKIPSSYGSIDCLSVTRDRIAVGTVST